MKNKKSTIIIAAVLGVCLLGVLSSIFIDWPVDTNNTGGNIAKSSRFSRKTATEGISNMQELLLNDNSFKSGVIMSYVVMSARAKEFNALVDMSESVAGEIPEFKDVLADMGKAKKMAGNVCASMDTAAKDLDTALGGEEAKDLAQNTTNAAIAYNTMQKQNSLATRFIETADSYLAGNEAEDGLKLVRDQWVDYQKMTATLDNDQEAADNLDKKGYLLSPEQSAKALGFVNELNLGPVIDYANLTTSLGLHTSLCEALVALDFGANLNQNSLLTDSITQQGLAEVGSVDNLGLGAALELSPELKLAAGEAFGYSMPLNNLSQNITITLNDIITVDWQPMQMGPAITGAINAVAGADATTLQSFTINNQ